MVENSGVSCPPVGAHSTTYAEVSGRNGGHVWIPPCKQILPVRSCDRVRSCVRPRYAARRGPRASMEIRGSGAHHFKELTARWPPLLFPIPICPISLPLPFEVLLTWPTYRSRRPLPFRPSPPLDACILPGASAWPRQPVPSCWPKRWRQVSAAFVPASARATSQPQRPCGRPT